MQLMAYPGLEETLKDLLEHPTRGLKRFIMKMPLIITLVLSDTSRHIIVKRMVDAGTSILIERMDLGGMTAEPIAYMDIQDSLALFSDTRMMNFVLKQFEIKSSKRSGLKNEKILLLFPRTGITTDKILP